MQTQTSQGSILAGHTLGDIHWELEVPVENFVIVFVLLFKNIWLGLCSI